MVSGEFDLGGKGVLVGVELARALKLHVGSRLAVYSVQTLKEMEEWAEKQRKHEDENRAAPQDLPLPEDYVVKGIFDVGYFEYNASVMVTSLLNAQDLYDLGQSVHGIMVMLRDPFKVDLVRSQLRSLLGPDYEITTWTEENSKILDALVVEKNVMFYLLFFIMIVAAFGIMNSLITFVVQKTKEIGMLKALGAHQTQILWLFLSQSLVVGIVGVLTGTGMGILAVTYRNGFLHLMNRLTGFELFPASIYSFTELPALIVPGDIAWICGSALFICLLAGLAPAWTAARLQPVEALRHE